jgi:hypothetical protein
MTKTILWTRAVLVTLTIAVAGVVLWAQQPVTITSGTVTVTGVATAANQVTEQGYVDGIETLLGTIDTDTGAMVTDLAAIEVLITASNVYLGEISTDTNVIQGTVDTTADAIKVLFVDAAGATLTLASDATVGEVALTEGPQILGKYSASALTTVTDGDTQHFWLTSGGALNVADGGGTLTVDGSLTAVTTVSTVTSLTQLGGVALPVEDVAETASGVGIYAMGVRRDTLAASTATTGDNALIGINESGAVWTAPTATTNGGAGGLRYISVGTTEDEHLVKSGAGTLYSITVTNTNAAVRYLKCEADVLAGTAPGTDTPEIGLAVPGATTGAGFSTTFPVGYSFTTGLTCWLVSGAADKDVAEVAANELMVFYTVK